MGSSVTVSSGLAFCNGIQISYEVIGDQDAEPLLLISGLAASKSWWPDTFCERLIERGYFVIRFDNRDAGSSTKSSAAPTPDVLAVLGGDLSSAAYELADMADDTADLLNALNVPKAHLVGVSLGGMIAQTIAIRHPERVLSLASIMATTGELSVSQPSAEAAALLLAAPPSSVDEAIDAKVRWHRVMDSPAYKLDDETIRQNAAADSATDFDPQASTRQFLAIVASGDRTEGLRRVRVPTVVIHGQLDPLVPVAGGLATAAAIPGSQTLIVDGMAHDLPEVFWPEIVAAIDDNSKRAALGGER